MSRRSGMLKRFFASLAGTAALFAVTWGPSPAGATAFSGSGCAQVNAIVARAPTEAQGQGITGNLASPAQNPTAQTASTRPAADPAPPNFGAGASTRSWCDTGDPFCASGNNLNTHLTYLNRYQNAAASFVLGRIGG